mgnify:CR=1 FL=1
MPRKGSIDVKRTLKAGGKSYAYYSLPAAEQAGVGDLSRLPYSIKVLLENLLRTEDGVAVKKADISAIAGWLKMRRAIRMASTHSRRSSGVEM